jgi:hypothetical protein
MSEKNFKPYTPTTKMDHVNRLKLTKKILEERIDKLEEKLEHAEYLLEKNRSDITRTGSLVMQLQDRDLRIGELEQDIQDLQEAMKRQKELAKEAQRQNELNKEIFWKELEELLEAREGLKKSRPIVPLPCFKSGPFPTLLKKE